MTLWGNNDNPSGNAKPAFANTSNSSTTSAGTGAKANTAKYYGNVYGVSATEQGNTSSHGPDIPAHAGWVSQKIGTGPIVSITISNPGAGYNANGFMIITANSANPSGSGGANANISFTVSSNANAQLNVITSATIVSGGDGFAFPPTVTANGSNITPATFTVTLGGRAGRRTYETLVATGTIVGDDSRDNAFFPGT